MVRFSGFARKNEPHSPFASEVCLHSESLRESYRLSSYDIIKIYQTQSFMEGTISWRSPSNIAIIKYWGKHGLQLPRNPNISFTLDKAFTETTLYYKTKSKRQKKDEINFKFLFEGKPNEAFRLKQLKFLTTLLPVFPFLTEYDLTVSSHNSFPHSAGIASSASSMSALAACLCDMDFEVAGITLDESDQADLLKKVSVVARLGSGSACRSVYPIMAAWGVCPDIKGSSDEYAVGFGDDIHPVFKTYHDAILIASRSEKSVSSRMGHGLMENNPFAAPRYQQANERMSAVVAALRSGDVNVFGQILEDEAMTLHALMMTSSPSFTLLKPNTLRMIELLREWREATKLPAFFSLDAGPNLHLLFPDTIKRQVKVFITNVLKPLCEDGMVIFDKVGQGAVRL
ncbi:MAG: diphosphomevalonate decarboxylase [Saprospiraceae bacterium]|nr:diphosphomevalonate decarboxylase [Saprospiraceae bacterium]